MTTKLNAKSLQQARKARKLSTREVANHTKISEDSLKKFETGDKEPSYKQLDRLADIYNVDLYSFFLDSLPEIENMLPDFRKTNPTAANLSPKGLARLWQVERRSAFVGELVKALGKNAPNTQSIARLTNRPIPEPTELRAAFDNWVETRDKSLRFSGSAEEIVFRQLRLFLEIRSCQTVFNSAPVDDYLGFYNNLSNKNKVVFVNRDIKNSKRKLFTLAHELSHFLYEEEGVSNPFIAKNSVEKQCNAFAASFLAPDSLVFRIIGLASSSLLSDPLRLVNLVSRETLLSRQAAALRLAEMDVINARQRATVFAHLLTCSPEM